MTATVRDVVAALDPDLPIYHVNSLIGAIHDETWFYRLFGGVVLTLVLSGLAACLVPALRAAGVDPLVAIRSE